MKVTLHALGDHQTLCHCSLAAQPLLPVSSMHLIFLFDKYELFAPVMGPAEREVTIEGARGGQGGGRAARRSNTEQV
jgi:hypothetical protein